MSTPWWSTLVAVGTAAWALAVPGDAALVAERSPPTWTIAFVRQMSADGPPYALFRGDLRTGSCRRVRSLGSSYPRPSPDGRHVAFGDPSTRILDTRSGSIIRLSTAPGGWLTWSRDGTALAFVAAGRARVVTTRGVATTDFAPGPGTAWSPDGRRVAFSRTTGDGRAGTLKTVLVIAPVGKPSAGKVVYEEPNPYAYSPYAAWAPDSRTLYHRAGNDVVALDTVTGKRRAGVQNAFVAGTWAPDERSILFTGTGPFGVNDVFVVKDDGSGKRRLTTTRPPARGVPQYGSFHLGWSASGEWVAYARRWGLAIMRRDGTQKRTVCTTPVGVVPLAVSWGTD